MATEKKSALNGAQLLKKLAETGTSATKLQPASQMLAFVHRKEKRIATAEEVLSVLERCGLMPPWEEWPQTPELTLKKARAIAETGAWNGIVEVEEVPVWETLLAGEELPDEEEAVPTADQAAEEFDPKKEVEDDAPHVKKNPLLAQKSDVEEKDALGLKPLAKRKPGRPKKDAKEAGAPV